MKKIFYSICSVLLPLHHTFASNGPEINCVGLPGCDNDSKSDYTVGIVGNLIAKSIEYIAIVAVLALMIAGIMYLISGGEEEKVAKAKKAIIWSLVGVVLSISALTLIRLVNTFQIPS